MNIEDLAENEVLAVQRMKLAEVVGLLERDHFKASYARKLAEHEKTLADAAQLCNERDEARANLAEAQAHAALLREALVDAAEVIIPMSKDPGCYSPMNFDEKQAVYIAEHHGFGNLMNIFCSKWYAKVRGAAFAVGPCISTAASVNRTIQAALAAVPADALAQVREQAMSDERDEWIAVLDEVKQILDSGGCFENVCLAIAAKRGLRRMRGGK